MPMKCNYVRAKTGNAAWNLATEEYLTRNCHKGELTFFLWQNAQTVVIGRNQNAWKECRVQTLLDDGGQLVRRLSGGGAVYHDLGNLNYSFCTHRADTDPEKQQQVILETVRGLGIPAEPTGRNDLTAGGRKFSGTASYETGDGCCHHGTLMLRVDTHALERYLQVRADKLVSKGVDSVRSRVMNLCDIVPELTLDSLIGRLQDALQLVYGVPPEEWVPDAEARDAIEQLAERFRSWEWTYGRKIAFTQCLEQHFGWGHVSWLLEVEKGRILSAHCESDAMDADYLHDLGKAVEGQAYRADMLLGKLEALPAGNQLRRTMRADMSRLLLTAAGLQGAEYRKDGKTDADI